LYTHNIRGGTQKFPELLKNIFKVFVQVWNFSPLRSTPLANGCSNPSTASNGNAVKGHQRLLVALDSISVEDFRQCFQQWERCWNCCIQSQAECLTLIKPNDIYICRTVALTSRRYILNIYSTNIHTEYFKHAAKSSFFSSSKCHLFHNATLFGSCIIRILPTGCAKI